MRGWFVAVALMLGLGVGLGALGLAARSARPDPAGHPSSDRRPGTPRPEPTSGRVEPKGELEGPPRYLLLGGGAWPESTEVSLEQDLALGVAVLRGPGRTLFGGGGSTLSVRILPKEPLKRGLVQRLGEIFQPRVARGSVFRRSRLDAQAASLAGFEQVLGQALQQGEAGPLLLYIAAHGEQGERARDNYVTLWGGQGLSVSHLATLHAQAPRPLRVVVASCFSGGFAELAFDGAEAARGAVKVPRCGLFAGTWDRPTSGCDPNPDRRAQEGYSMHFLNALRSRDRDGHTLSLREVDLDGDGRIGLLDAHTWARIHSLSIDVPTTTSERYLREVVGAAPRGKVGQSRLAPRQELAVVRTLGAALDVPDLAAAQARFAALQAQLGALSVEMQQAEAALDRAYLALSTRILERWPMLDDAYHPLFDEVVQQEAAQVAALLDGSSEARAYASAGDRVQALDGQLWDLQVREARVLRLLRAHETLALAGELARRGGPALSHYRALLRCERGGLDWQP